MSETKLTPTAKNPDAASATAPNFLPKILAVLVVIAVMVGCFFAYNVWKDQQKAKAEEPFYLAAKEALDEAHKMQSAVGIGINYQKYGDQLIAMAPKVDNLLRAAVDTAIANVKPDTKVFCQQLLAAREAYKDARGWWEIKIKYPDTESALVDQNLQADWGTASTAIDEADKVYAKLKNQ